MNKIQNLVIYLFQKLNRSLGSVELTKLIYLIDVEFFKYFGEKLTDCDYVRERLGPYSRKIKETLLDLDKDDIIDINLILSKGKSTILKRSHSLNKKDVKILPEFKKVERLIIENVLNKIGKLEVKKLEKLSYKTEPMREILEKEKRFKEALILVPLDFNLIKRDIVMKEWIENKEKEEKDPNLEYEQEYFVEQTKFRNIIKSYPA